ncbi:hypothetical protein L1049_019383 [Liquidambar formosana]|uniref:Uncharacterized protein n=1 Tax=Liquidambar formosana TaxID=63359 RepID=A0AAP0SBN4_LIQFO
MERLPLDLCHKIFCLLDHQNLATAQQGRFIDEVRNWVNVKFLIHGSGRCWPQRIFYGLTYSRRGGEEIMPAFYAPIGSKPWKDVYEVQDRCDRVGLGLKIIREGGDYYLVHQGEIQRHLGSRRKRKGTNSSPLSSKRDFIGEESLEGEQPCLGILDKILFFLGDLEAASIDAKRTRVL